MKYVKKYLLPFIVVVAIVGVIYYLGKNPEKTEQTEQIKFKIKKDKFILSVKATGELQAKNSKQLRGPSTMQSVNIYQTSIDNLIPEGTLVKKGDFVASLNRNEIANKMKDVSTEIDKIMTQLEQARIDTAIELRSLRDELVNLEFNKKEKELFVEQSRYEPEMVIRQTQLDLERTARDLSQTTEKLKLKEQQAKAKMDEINTTLVQNQNKMARLSETANQFTVFAPEDGMVIYYRNWRGKVTAGSEINAWDPIIAELPDLTDMITKSYVNEVDINKIKVGLDANVKVDALPDKSFAGKVIQVANIGEELRGYDSKVFEVIIQIMEVDSLMRPSMTTSAEIFLDEFPDVIAIPIEGLMVDTITYVHKVSGNRTVKQEVIPGLTGDLSVTIDFGLEPGDEIMLSIPPNADKLEFVMLDPELKAEVLKKQEEEKKARQAKYAEKEKEAKNISPPGSQSGGGGGMIIFN